MRSDLTDKELGTVQAVLERYNREWLPALLAMKAKVDRGEMLDERELSLLDNAIDEAKGGKIFAEKHPQYRSLVDKAMHLYDHIVQKAKQNCE